MGFGDWLLATGQVKRLHEANGRKVLVVGRGNRIQWSEVFANNPRIATQADAEFQTLVNGSGLRPYIAGKTATRWLWKRWDIAPGEVWFSEQERKFAEPYRGAVLIEPHTKVANGNKAWRWERWQAVVDAMPAPYVQVGTGGFPVLRGARFVATTFREGMAVLSVCRAFVGTEGALHHAAAALNVPAVVLWSEFVSPEYTGYPTQRNIRHAGAACGSRLPCAVCRTSMLAITVDEVVNELRAVL